MELGVTWEGASGKTVVAIDVEPCLMGGKKSLDDFAAAANPIAFFPLMTRKVNVASVVLTRRRRKDNFDGPSDLTKRQRGRKPLRDPRRSTAPALSGRQRDR